MPCLLSVNVGFPRDIEWKDRIVRTGIWKNPVRGHPVRWSCEPVSVTTANAV
jgi:hypothetical protein